MQTPEEIIAREEKNPSTYPIRNPRLAFLVGGILALWGVFAIVSIPKESSPYIEFGVVVVSTVYTGASAVDVDNLITREIEDQIKDIRGLNKFSSVSRNSISTVTLEFEPGTDMTQAVGDVRSKVDQAKSALPAEIDDDPLILEIDSSVGAFLSVMLTGDATPLELTDLAEELKPVLEDVPNVSGVEIVGGTEREITVKVDPRRLEAIGINLTDIVNAIRVSHSDVPVGDFTIDGLEYSIRFAGKHRTADDVRQVVVANLKNEGYPSLLTVGDIAVVEERAEADAESITRYGYLRDALAETGSPVASIGAKIKSAGEEALTGNPFTIAWLLLIGFFVVGVIIPLIRVGGVPMPRLMSLLFAVLVIAYFLVSHRPPPELKTFDDAITPAVELQLSKKSETDILAVDKNARAVLAGFAETRLPPGVSMNFLNDSAAVMREDYRGVVKAGIEAFVIVMIFILLFVGLIEGLLTSIIIPLSFLVTIGLLEAMGRTLNFMTNFSMILALGILVDTAIVVVQGTNARIKSGFPPRQAALLALHEFRAPLISSNLTTIAVFIPLLSLPGILGQFLIFIPITVITVLTVALILSLTVLPAYVSVLIPDPHQARRKKSRFPRWNRFGDAFRHWFDDRVDRVTESYRSKLEWLLTKRFRRLTAFAVTILLFILSFRIPLPFELFPSGDSPMMSVSLRMPQGTVTEKTQQPTALVENILLRQPEVSRVRSVVSGSAGDLTIELLTNKDRERKGLMTSKELENKWEPLFDSIARRYGATVRIGTASMGPPSEAPVAFRVIAEDRNRLPEAEAVTNELTDLIKTIPGTSGVTNNIEKIPGEFRFRVNRERAVALGVIPEQIPGLTRTALKGQTAATIARDGRDIDITVEFDDSGFTTIEELKRLKIYTPAGVGIELGQVIDIEQEDALSAINRQDGDLAFTVSSLVGDGGNAQAITLAAQEKIAALDLPAGVAVADAGENQENAGLIFGLLSGLVIAVLLMFLIIVTQFNAFFQPLLILFTILFAQIGVAVGLYLTDTPRSLPYLIGVISLAGIVVNHAIILVDQINNLRDRRRESGEADIVVPAAVEGGASRILPVVLTTLTTTVGIIPLIFQDAFWEGLSFTIVFGLLFATVLTLFLTPALYVEVETEPGVLTAFLLASLTGAVAVSQLLGGQIVPAAIIALVATLLFGLAAYLIRRGERLVVVKASPEI